MFLKIDFPVLKIPLGITCIVFYVLYFLDLHTAAVRGIKFHKAAVERGGEIIDPWNKRIIENKNGLLDIILLILFFVLFLAILATYFLDSLQKYNMILPITVFSFLSNYFYSYRGMKYSYPGVYYCIFLDFNEGMLFGNALFTYDIMSGLVATGKNNGFELYHEGKKVAEGKILPDDFKHLQDILEVRNKYRDVLEEVI